jgi:hypothetical protein
MKSNLHALKLLSKVYKTYVLLKYDVPNKRYIAGIITHCLMLTLPPKIYNLGIYPFNRLPVLLSMYNVWTAQDIVPFSVDENIETLDKCGPRVLFTGSPGVSRRYTC